MTEIPFQEAQYEVVEPPEYEYVPREPTDEDDCYCSCHDGCWCDHA